MLANRVFPAAALVRASFWRVRALSRLDLPTFERPANANCARSSRTEPSRGPDEEALVTSVALRIFTSAALLAAIDQAPAGRAVVGVDHGIDRTHRHLALLFFEDMRRESGNA